MKRDNQLSQLQITNHAHSLGKEGSRSHEVHLTLKKKRSLAFTTVATLLSRLEKRGLITHRTQGRTYIYQPKVQEDEVRRSMVRDVVDRLFKGHTSELVSHLLTENQISPGDLKKVRSLIDKAEKKESK
ncbi:BlaI/MecI/CopY family transcriptional regulator [bacterium]|nr:BlaI/MecI/CopY family transcriptional regulator [bacterium]